MIVQCTRLIVVEIPFGVKRNQKVRGKKKLKYTPRINMRKTRCIERNSYIKFQRIIGSQNRCNIYEKYKFRKFGEFQFIYFSLLYFKYLFNIKFRCIAAMILKTLGIFESFSSQNSKYNYFLTNVKRYPGIRTRARRIVFIKSVFLRLKKVTFQPIE